MCLSTVYSGSVSDDRILMKNVMKIECNEETITLTDLMERKQSFHGSLQTADLTEGVVVISIKE